MLLHLLASKESANGRRRRRNNTTHLLLSCSTCVMYLPPHVNRQ
jgi:hypothetical protein